MTSLLLHLHDSLKVTPLEDNQVQVTVTLQSDEFIHYVRLLDSLTGFLHVIKNKDRLAKAKAHYESEEYAEETGKVKAQYYSRLVASFDLYTSQGFDRKAAIKQISADLRRENHPWSSPDLVRPSLVAAGRGGRPGRPRRQQ
ncbi:MAG: hypothetical protein PF441_11630 [Desulfuromusa sp.]|jgi:hypothetical protein|nr:hypothetical protein [Desulfuromusa sp.]